MTQPSADPTASLAALVERAARAGAGAPPVDTWHPARCGRIDMRIDAAGAWHHEGSPIRREALVRLFSTVLRGEADGSYVLVTPAEKLDIVVEDLPFVAVEMAATGEGAGRDLTFRTSLGDVVRADAEHPLRLVDDADGFRPCVRVRGRLDARLTRAAALELAELVEERDGVPGVWSGGAFFSVDAGA